MRPTVLFPQPMNPMSVTVRPPMAGRIPERARDAHTEPVKRGSAGQTPSARASRRGPSTLAFGNPVRTSHPRRNPLRLRGATHLRPPASPAPGNSLDGAEVAC